MGAEEEEEGQTADLRTQWLEEKVLSTLKVKPEKWAEMDEESLFPIKDFLDSTATCLFITLGERDKICASLTAPEQGRKKSCFFLKARTKANSNFAVSLSLKRR